MNKPKKPQKQTPGTVQRRDMFSTPRYATELLLPFINHRFEIIWECAAGEHRLANVFKVNGYSVFTSDIRLTDMNYNCNFLSDPIPDKLILDWNATCIITNPPFCYDSQTETLTNNGWKLLKDVSVADRVLSLDSNSLEISWDDVKNVISSPYQGEMIYFKNKLVDLLVTPNHRIYAVNNKGDVITTNKIYGKGRDTKSKELILASDVKSPHCLNRSGFIWKGKEEEYFVVPSVSLIYNKQQRVFEEIKVKMEDWCAFFGIWVSEGCTRGSTKEEFENHKGKQKHLYEVSIKQKEPNATIIRELLSKLPFNVRERKYPGEISMFEISSVQLWTYLHQFGNSHTKFIPSNLKELSPRFLDILLKWYLFGDGCMSMGGRYFYTVSRRLANDLVEISVKLGSFASYIYDKTNKGYKGCLAKQKRAFLGKRKSIVQYNDLVYCLELKNNHIFLVRRNGKLAFSGNSLKKKFFEKCIEYNLPLALLIPADYSLWVIDAIRKYGCEKIIPDHRIDYITPNQIKKSSAQFHSMWLTRYLNLGQTETFVELTKEMKKNI